MRLPPQEWVVTLHERNACLLFQELLRAIAGRTTFSFVEPNGTQRTGSASLAQDWKPTTPGQVKVSYTPGANGRARVAGSLNWIGLGMFFVSLCLIGFVGIRLWLEAVEATSPPKKKKRPRRTDFRDYRR
jgi:hypothetical protein